MVKLRFRLGLVTAKLLAHSTSRYNDYGSNLHVNEHQKIRHYLGRSTEGKKSQMAIFYYCKSALKHDGGVYNA